MRVKCLAQEHNTMTGPLNPEPSSLTTRPLHLSPMHSDKQGSYSFNHTKFHDFSKQSYQNSNLKINIPLSQGHSPDVNLQAKMEKKEKKTEK